jgi:molybdopterin molybdotransferase
VPRKELSSAKVRDSIVHCGQDLFVKAMSTTNPQNMGNLVLVADVLAWIDAHVPRIGQEAIPIAEAAGRILAEDVVAGVDHPPFTRVATDGFALRANETTGATAYNPLPFRLAPRTDELPPNGAVRVMSGDVLPRNTDAVVRMTYAEVSEESVVTIIDPIAAGNEVEHQGCQLQRGSTFVAAGRRLSPADVGALASAGLACVSVTRRPRVHALLAAARIIEAGQPLAADDVYDANGPMLRALIARDGGILVEQRHVERQRQVIADAFASHTADAFIVAGGTGCGFSDHAAAAVADVGELAIHGIALRPGETTGIGLIRGIPVILLPGAPVSCLWSYELIAARVIRRLGGREPNLPFRSRTMTTVRKIVSEIGTLEIHPVRCLDKVTVEPVASFSEAGLTSAARGSGFILVPESSEGYPQGAAVKVYLYDGVT